MTWTCVKCGKEIVSLNDCTKHILETSGHIAFNPNDGTPTALDMSFLLRGALHNCFEESLTRLADWTLKTPHAMGDMMTLSCMGMRSCSCPIDGRTECKLDFHDHGKVGYHEFRNMGSSHYFSLYANLPLIELLFSKGYPKIVSSIREKVEIDERQFKELEKQGKAFRLEYMRTGAEEGQSWNVIAKCRKCNRYFPYKMLLGTDPQKLPKNLPSKGLWMERPTRPVRLS